MNTQSPILETWMIYPLIVALGYQTLQLDLQNYQTKFHQGSRCVHSLQFQFQRVTRNSDLLRFAQVDLAKKQVVRLLI